MSAQLSLYEAPEPLDDLRSQFMRMPPEMRVWLDANLERGAVLAVVEDREAECDRLLLAARHGLRWRWQQRFRGLRREWFRKVGPNEEAWTVVDGLLMTRITYEPRLERELLMRASDERGRGQGRRSHWPVVLP